MASKRSSHDHSHNLQFEHNETTPLLSETLSGETVNESQNDSTQEEQSSGDDSDDTPLPMTQILLLCFARFVEPVVYFSIFPFVQEMVVHVGHVPKAQVGFYSGLIESLFSLTQMILMIPWGRASDYFGRKPVLLLSMCGIMIFTTLFGFSQTMWQMILFRCLAGVFAGSIVTLRTMTAEHSTKKTQARAFSFFQFASNLGIFIGPFIGGVLADPAHQYPSVFKRIRFFHQFPYALPTMTTGTICAISILTTACFVEETKQWKSTASIDEPERGGDETMSIWKLLQSPGVSIVIFVYGVIFILAFGYTAIIPVWWFEPIELGGCNFSPLFISIFLAAGGLLQSIYGLLVFPPLHRRIGTKTILLGCAIAWPIFFILHPLGNYLLRRGSEVLFWVLVCFLEVGVSALSMAFIAVQLAVNDSAPSRDTLGTLNGVALAVMSGTRAFTPALYTSILAVSVSKQILEGQLAWVILMLNAMILLVIVPRMPGRP